MLPRQPLVAEPAPQNGVNAQGTAGPVPLVANLAPPARSATRITLSVYKLDSPEGLQFMTLIIGLLVQSTFHRQLRWTDKIFGWEIFF